MYVKGHGQGHNVINYGVIWKSFIRWVYMPNMKSQFVTVQKQWGQIKIMCVSGYMFLKIRVGR